MMFSETTCAAESTETTVGGGAAEGGDRTPGKEQDPPIGGVSLSPGATTGGESALVKELDQRLAVSAGGKRLAVTGDHCWGASTPVQALDSPSESVLPSPASQRPRRGKQRARQGAGPAQLQLRLLASPRRQLQGGEARQARSRTQGAGPIAGGSGRGEERARQGAGPIQLQWRQARVWVAALVQPEGVLTCNGVGDVFRFLPARAVYAQCARLASLQRGVRSGSSGRPAAVWIRQPEPGPHIRSRQRVSYLSNQDTRADVSLSPTSGSHVPALLNKLN